MSAAGIANNGTTDLEVRWGWMGTGLGLQLGGIVMGERVWEPVGLNSRGKRGGFGEDWMLEADPAISVGPYAMQCSAEQSRVDLQPSAARGCKLIGARVDAWAVDRCCASKPLEKVGERGPAKVMFSFCRKCPCEMSCDAIQTAIINRN